VQHVAVTIANVEG